jgi:hypothetical protein
MGDVPRINRYSVVLSRKCIVRFIVDIFADFIIYCIQYLRNITLSLTISLSSLIALVTYIFRAQSARLDDIV